MSLLAVNIQIYYKRTAQFEGRQMYYGTLDLYEMQYMCSKSAHTGSRKVQ